MGLLTIADLQQPSNVRAQYVEHAKSLSVLWDQWKAQQSGSYEIPVNFYGEGGREPGLHASEASGCARKLVYALRGTHRTVLPEHRDINMQRRMDKGTLIHALTQYEFHQMSLWLNGAITFRDEIKIDPSMGGFAAAWYMYSHCDGEFTFWHNQAPYMRVGLEIKTMSDPEYEKMKKPLDYHLDQVCLYMLALDLPLMWLLCINKSNSHHTQSLTPFLFQFDSHRWTTKLEPRIRHMYQIAQSGSNLPAREEGKPCGWCPFAHTCNPHYLKTGRRSRTPSPRDFRC